ncbi:gas vesicle protein GvpJ [Nocardioides sp. AN3]
MTQMTGGYLARPAPSGLADVLDIVLDKGIVVDAYAQVGLLGIELVTLDARIVVSSVDTYLRFAEATNRLDLQENGPPSLLDILEEGVGEAVETVASTVVEKKVEAGLEKVEEVAGSILPGGDKLVEKAAEKLGEVIGPDESDE